MRFRLKDFLAVAAVGVAALGLWACDHAATTDPGSAELALRTRLAQVIVAPSSASVLVGGTTQFTAYGRNRGGDSVRVSPSWSSSNSAVAAVSGSGLVTGVSAGSATITASAGGFKGTATVAVAGVTLGNPASV